MSSNAKGEGWTRYFDNRYSQHYFYNSITGESVWDVQETASLTDSEQNQENSSLIPDSEANDAANDRPHNPIASDDSKNSNNVKISHNPSIVWQYKLCVILQAILIECPLCIIESLLKSICCLAFFPPIILLLICKITRLIDVYFIFHELIMYLSLMTSLCLCPLLILFAYKQFICSCCCVVNLNDDVDEWELDCIPTLLGLVDSRRLYVISAGSGSMSCCVSIGERRLGDTWMVNVSDVTNGVKKLLFHRKMISTMTPLETDDNDDDEVTREMIRELKEIGGNVD